MKIKETKSYSFYFHKESNDSKLDFLFQKALKIRDFKNELSKKFTLFDVLASKFDNINKFSCKISGLSSFDIQKTIEDTHKSYYLKLDKYQSQIKFKVQKAIDFQ